MNKIIQAIFNWIIQFFSKNLDQIEEFLWRMLSEIAECAIKRWKEKHFDNSSTVTTVVQNTVENF